MVSFVIHFKISLIKPISNFFTTGNFSFGSLQKFRSSTIVDFIENAMLHSRSGRFLFFLHRRPIMGPLRVQLLYPVSRFKKVQSLQHNCRYVFNVFNLFQMINFLSYDFKDSLF